MKSKYLPRPETYDGRQLESLWAYREHGVRGDSIVAFTGPCEVGVAELVDLQDAKAGAIIRSQNMLHFIAEHFELDLEAAILRQYLLVSSARDLLKGSVRTGNDLHLGKAKLSVSIATLTPVSSKIHFGINISSKGTPVKTLGLADLRIAPKGFAVALMKRYVDDHARMAGARSKVRAVP